MRDEAMRHSESEAIRGIRDWVSSRLGMDLGDAQSATFRGRIEHFCRHRGETPSAVLEAIRHSDRSTVTAVVDFVSTTHTFFFREPSSFDLLARVILPSLPSSGPLRLWSAAASSGEEAYSIAMTALTALGAGATRVRVLGTDVNARQIDEAERGVYAPVQFGPVARPELRLLETVGDMRVVPEPIKAMCSFRRLNLARVPWPFAQKFHVIFLRNVLYYFTAETRRTVVEACYDAVVPGGWLVTSLTEPMRGIESRWKPMGPACFRKVTPQ